MTVLSIPALIISVIAFYVGGYHLLVFLRRPQSRVDLTFALTAICVGFYDIFCAALYNVTSPADGVQVQRWQLISLAFLSIAYVWFVVDYTTMKSRLGPWLFTTIFAVFALIGIFDSSGLAWSDQPLIINFQFPFFGWDITYYEMEFGPAMLLEGFMLMVFYLYLYLVAIYFYWKKNPGKAKPLVLGIGLFMAGMTEDVFVAFGYYSFIYTIEYAFIGMILVMAYKLSTELVERGEVKKELQKSEERYRDFVERTDNLVTRIDAEGRITYINHVGEKIFGRSRDDLIGLSAFQFIHPDDQARTDKWFKGCVSRKLSHSTIENRQVNSSTGEIAHMLWTSSFTYDKKGQIRTVNGIAHNITDRRKSEQAAEESRARLQIALRASNIGLWDWNLITNEVYFSPEWKKNIGYGEDEIPDRYEEWETRLHPEDNSRTLSVLSDYVEGRRPDYESEFRLRHKDGSYRWIFARGEILRDDDGTPSRIFGCHIDITDQRRMEEELRRSHKLESLGILAGGIAHDFNNMLTAVMNTLFLVRQSVENNSKAFDRLKQAEKAVANASSLTHQLLTFSSGGEPVKTTASIIEIVRENADFSIRGSNVKCEYTFPDNLWSVEVDKGQISQVIQNIIINADQSMSEGGCIRIDAENVSIDSDNSMLLGNGKYIKIIIKDEGPGISEEHLKKIFDPFFTTKEKGQGLGLAACHSIIKKHEGHISVTSRLGVGTVFTVYLPATEKKISKEAISEEITLSNGGRILIMDDEEMVRNSLGEMLKNLGYEIELAVNGEEAVDKYKKALESSRPYGIVILDLTIPGGMGGKKTVKKLREFAPDGKAVVSSGYSNDPIMANYKEYGFKGVLSKPYTIEPISRVLRNALKE